MQAHLQTSGSDDAQAPAPPAAITGLKQRILTFLFYQAAHGIDIEQQSFFRPPTVQADPADSACNVRVVRQTTTMRSLYSGKQPMIHDSSQAGVPRAADQAASKVAKVCKAQCHCQPYCHCEPPCSCGTSTCTVAVTDDSRNERLASKGACVYAASIKSLADTGMSMQQLGRPTGAALAALQAFHRRRAALEELTIDAVHAVDASRVTLLATCPGGKVMPFLLMYNWRQASVEAAHTLYSPRVLASVLWCAPRVDKHQHNVA